MFELRTFHTNVGSYFVLMLNLNKVYEYPIKFKFEAGARRYQRGVPWRITAYESALAFLADHTELNRVLF